MEKEADALGHVPQVGCLAPDQQVQRDVDHLVLRYVRVASALRLREQLLRPVPVISEQLAVQRVVAIDVARGAVCKQQQQVLLLVADALLLEAKLALQQLEDAAKSALRDF